MFTCSNMSNIYTDPFDLGFVECTHPFDLGVVKCINLFDLGNFVLTYGNYMYFLN
jgi:hypothetical protein